jgi:hypothetical protein
MEKTLAYNPYFIMMFEQHSKSRYTRLEERVLRWLLECACTPSSHWSRCDYKNIPYLIYELKRVPTPLMKGSPKTTFAAGGIGTISAPMCHVAAFLWDFNSDYRIQKNSGDIFRKLVPMRKDTQNDHNYTLWVRKWLPPPLSARDFYLVSAWKRLDERRIVIFVYDRDDGSYEEETNKLPEKFKRQEAVRASNHAIYILEESKDENGVKTKLSLISVINAKGYLPLWVVRSRRAQTLSIIQEAMEYFHSIPLRAIFGGKNPHSGYKHFIANNLARGISENNLGNFYLSNQFDTSADPAHTAIAPPRGGSKEYGENPESVLSQLMFEDGATPPEMAAGSAPSTPSFAIYLKNRQEWNLANDSPDDSIVVNFNELSKKSLQPQSAHSKSSALPFFNHYYITSGLQDLSGIFSRQATSDAR